MTATLTPKVCTGASAGTETTATNWNLQSIDAYDGTGTDHATNVISKLVTGTNYSYERWLRLEFTGAFTSISNVKIWASTLSLSDANLTLNAGETTSGSTPVDTVSATATASIPTTEGTAIDVSPVAGITTTGDKTDYFVMQLVVPDTVTTAGSTGTQTLTISYDEV